MDTNYIDRIENIKWQPLIPVNAPEYSPFIKKLSEIAETIFTLVPSLTSNNGIASDRIGAVLFLFYYSRFTDDDRYAEKAYDLLSLVFDEVCTEIEENRLSGGSNALAGVGWAMEHLAQNDFLDIDTNDMLGDIDEFLYNSMLNDMAERNYDYIAGALQKGLYFLSRKRNPEAETYLSNLVNVLEKVSDKDENGEIKFLTRVPDDMGGESFVCNLGMAHGMPSIVWFLGKLLEMNIALDKVPPLLHAFGSYIFRQAQDPTLHNSHFPGWVVGESSPAESRLAWCYGDPGLAIGIFQASIHNGNKEWQKQTINALIHSTKRRELKKNGIVDAGMCHGTSGIAHIYNRMFHYTHLEDFKQASLYWLNETLKMAAFKDGYAGYKCRRKDWFNEVDIIDGITGIGLTLLSALSEIEPRWDRMMMLS